MSSGGRAVEADAVPVIGPRRPNVEAAAQPTASVVDRPRLRGRMHQVALGLSIVGLAWLVRAAPTPRAQVAAWVYGLTSVALYLTSSSYHVFARSPRARLLMRRADHSMIYVLIAGTFTPIAILALRGPGRWALLTVVWCAAVFGVAFSVTSLDRFPRFGSALYMVMGWGPAVALPTLAERPRLLVLIALGGVLYTVGAVLFSLSRPRLFPTWFGYHEVWHTFGVAGGICLYVANLELICGG